MALDDVCNFSDDGIVRDGHLDTVAGLSAMK